MGGFLSQPKIPNAAKSAAAGIQADLEQQPFNYLINAASQLGNKVTIGGKDYDFSGLGDAATSAVVSDKMAQTLLDLQREKSPIIIQQRLNELQAADPEGYALRKTLFDKILEYATNNPDRPISNELQTSLQDELAKGAGFDDARQKEQVTEGVRGKQIRNGIILGNAPAREEAGAVLNAGESLRNQRQQDALSFLQSGQSPEDQAYRQFQQNLNNLGSFVNGQSPTQQFQQVGNANQQFDLTGGVDTNTFNPNAAGQGISSAFSQFNTQQQYQNAASNPYLSGLSIGLSGAAAAKKSPLFNP